MKKFKMYDYIIVEECLKNKDLPKDGYTNISGEDMEAINYLINFKHRYKEKLKK